MDEDANDTIPPDPEPLEGDGPDPELDDLELGGEG